MRVIKLNGRQFRVRKNLWDFLYTARFKSNASGTGYATVRWWIDAICIDQTNFVEKGQQVRIMGEIYTGAKRVILWLGKGDACLPSSLHVLRLQSYILNERYAEFADPAKRIPDHITGSSSRYWKPTRSEIALLIHASSSGYWTRAWVVQEISLAQEVLIWQGDMQIQFDFLSHLYETALEACKLFVRDDILREKTMLLRNRPMTLLLSSRTGRTGLRARRFANLLRAYRHLQCSEPRDRVYSLLSLAKAGEDVRPDYEVDSLSVFFNVLWACRDEFCLCLSVVLMDILQLSERIEQHMVASMHSTFHNTSLMSEPYIEITSELAHPIDAEQCDHLLDVLQVTDVFTCSCYRARRKLDEWLPGSRPPSRILLYCFERMLGMYVPLHIVFARYGNKIMPHGIYEEQSWKEVHSQEMPCELSSTHPSVESRDMRQLTLRMSAPTLLYLAKRIYQQPTYRLNEYSFTCAHYASHRVLYDLRPCHLTAKDLPTVPLGTISGQGHAIPSSLLSEK